MAENNNKVIKMVGAGCVVLLLLSMCCCGGMGFYMKSELAAPGGQAQGFLDDVRGSNHAQALSRMSGSYQSSHALPAFQQAVGQIPALSQQTGFTVQSFSVNPILTTIEGTLSTPTGDTPVSFTLSQMGEHWYIDSVMVGMQSLQ